MLICTKWFFESDKFDSSLKVMIGKLAGATEPMLLANLTTNSLPLHEEENKNAEVQSSGLDLPVETVVLPDRMVYLKNLYDRVREKAAGWPITFKPNPPSFQFMPVNFGLPSSLKSLLAASKAEKCAEGSVCLLTRKKTFEVVCRVELSDIDEAIRTAVDHPVMILAAKAGEAAIEYCESGGQPAQVANTETYYFRDKVVLTDVEPCFMCAMALVHSRVNTVVFKNLNKVDGAFVSHATEINCLKQLNHSFNVA